MEDKLIRNFLVMRLPIYVKLKPTSWTFAMWSAPTVPATTWEYVKALRVTLRDSEWRPRIVLKRGEIG